MTGLRMIATKAMRLHDAGHVHEIAPARTFRVDGDHGTYIVYLRDGLAHASCTCPAVGTCSHIGAAMLEADAVDTLVMEALQ